MNDYEIAAKEIHELFNSCSLKGEAGDRHPTKDEGGWEHYAYSISIWHDRPGPSDKHRFAYKQGVAVRKSPVPSEVFACHCRDWRDAQAPFDEWASEYGYDIDSRKAYAVWETCRGSNVLGVVSRDIVEQFAELYSRL